MKGLCTHDALSAAAAASNARSPQFLPCAGTGLAGLCCAAAGAHMLLTDVDSVAHSSGILCRNIEANVSKQQARHSCSTQQPPQTGPAPGQVQQQQQQPWSGSRPLGAGTVACSTLDFCRPLHEQVRSWAAGPCEPGASRPLLLRAPPARHGACPWAIVRSSLLSLHQAKLRKCMESPPLPATPTPMTPHSDYLWQ